MRGLAHRRVVHVEVAPDGPHHDLARVHADPDLDIDPMPGSYVLGVAGDAVLHPQGGIAGPRRVVLVRQRRAEEGHDPIAHHLIDRPLVAVDGLHHPFEHRIEDLPRLLGITVGEQLHRAFQVGEEHGDVLALTFQGCFRREDALGEVLRRVGLGRAEPRSRGRRDGQPRRLRALGAELRRRRELPAALRARARQGRGALLAELRARLVLVLAPWAFHQ